MITAPAGALGDGVRDVAAAHPDRVALSVGGRDVGYAELHDTAGRWAGGLVEVGGGRPRRVGVFGSRSEISYAGVLAVLRAGAAFVPLNPRYPVERTRSMVERADLDAIIVDEAARPRLAEVVRGMAAPPALLAPGTREPVAHGAPVLTAGDLASATPPDPAPDPEPDEMAYLLFTSGSTGGPKGVPVTHGNLRAFLDVNQQRYRITAADRLTQTFDQTFDLSVFDLFMAWENGARVCAMEPIELLAPFRYLERNDITVWFSVPSVAAVLDTRGALTPGRMPGLRWSLFCGEALPTRLAQRWAEAAPHSVVENLYGPTELTIACAAHRFDPHTSPARGVHGTVPIGRLYPGLDGLVMDEDLVPVAEGRTGELCVAGPQTTPGYWRAPKQTARRFFHRDGARYYRTGDLVRAEHGEYVFVGRTDSQVQVGGHRVELGEVEGALRDAGAIEAVCLLSDDGTLDAVVSGDVDPDALREAVAARLPVYMVPKSLHVIDRMPVNGNGKIDRTAVRAWTARPHEGGAGEHGQR